MLINFREQAINNFLIPAFTVSKGEIVIIRLPNGPFFCPLQTAIVEILTGKTVSGKVEILSPFRYAEHFKENWFRYHFFPVTVGEYVNRYANRANPVYNNIYDIPWMKPEIKVCTLAGTPRRQLSLYSTLSWTTNIIFDLVGVDPQGGQDIYSYVKTVVNSGGAAILIDNNDEFKNDCAAFIQAEYLGNALQL